MLLYNDYVLSPLLRDCSRITSLAILQNWFRNGFEEQNNEFKVFTWPPNSTDLNPVKHLWDMLDKQDCIIEALPYN